MSKLLVRSKDAGQSGVFAQVSAPQAGWDLLNMAALRLFSGETYRGAVGEHEHISVVLGGKGLLTVDGERFEVGGRPDVFSGMPHAFYLPRGRSFEVEALSQQLEIVSCWVPTDRDFPLAIIRPEQCAVELRGGGNASRQINSIRRVRPAIGWSAWRCILPRATGPAIRLTSTMSTEKTSTANCSKPTWKRSISTS